MPNSLNSNFTSLSRENISGGGQVTVSGNHCFVGHMDAPDGTTIFDVSDPRNPKITAKLTLDDLGSHTHKVRVVGDFMVVNYEQNKRHYKRKGDGIAGFEQAYRKSKGTDPSDAEIAEFLGVTAADIPILRKHAADGYDMGGFRIYDIKDKSNPRLLCHKKTFGFGVHRFDIDENYLYMSTEMPGYVGNILMVYSFADPSNPVEVGRWAMPEQENFDNARPMWKGYENRLHHGLRFGDVMWASCWHAGFHILDIKDAGAIKSIGSYDYHPMGKNPTHTILPLKGTFNGRKFAAVCDEEHAHKPGQLPAHIWLFDVTDFNDIKPASTFHVSELDSPFARTAGRFGAHQFQEVVDGSILFTSWFSGGLRAVDVSDPYNPVEVGHYIPQPTGGHKAPQSNDVYVDERGIVYLLDRLEGLDILEFNGN